MLPCVAVVPPPDAMNSKIEEVVEENITENLNSDYEEGSTKLFEVAPSVESEEPGEVQRVPESWSRGMDCPGTLSVR
jgi:hypothetical protein